MHLQLSLQLQAIEARGHEFLMIFQTVDLTPADIVYLRVTFGLHGQVFLCNDEGWNEHVMKMGIQWQGVVVAVYPTEAVQVVFADYNRLVQFWLSLASDTKVEKWGINRGPDPMLEWDEFSKGIKRKFEKIRFSLPRDRIRSYSKPIFEYIKDNYELFNGFGANHTTEALFYAGIHPFTSVEQCSRPEVFARLLQGLKMASQPPPRWTKYIPKTTLLSNPLEYNISAATYYIKGVNKVYGKNNVLVSKEVYERMLQEKQITLQKDMDKERYMKQKRVRLPVYEVYRANNLNNKKKSSTVYTCIEALPPDPRCHKRNQTNHYAIKPASKHNPDNMVPHTGPESFRNNLVFDKFRRIHAGKGRRRRVQTKPVGRPSLRKPLSQLDEDGHAARDRLRLLAKVGPKHKLTKSGKQRRL